MLLVEAADYVAARELDSEIHGLYEDSETVEKFYNSVVNYFDDIRLNDEGIVDVIGYVESYWAGEKDLENY